MPMKPNALFKFAGVALTAATLASASWASPNVVFAESVDPVTGAGTGDLVSSAQMVTGTGSSTVQITITGDFADTRGGNPLNGVDLYAISLGQGGPWSFDSFGSAVADTQLFLFDSAGMGVSWNNDASLSPVNTLSQFTVQLAAGTYYFGVSLYGFDAIDGSSGSIFDTLGNGGSALAGSGALSGWADYSGAGLFDISGYTLNVTLVPEPGALPLMLAGLGLIAGLSARARRRAA